MVYAMKCIRSGQEFHREQYDTMEEYQQYEADYKSAITIPQTDASFLWLDLAKKVMGKMPYSYERNYFTEEFMETLDGTQTLYFQFATAAREHYLLVEEYLNKYGFSLKTNL